jgi:glycosyltransferase involved in cell wall biosynthesis
MIAKHIGLVFHDFSTGGSERIAIRLGNAWARAGRKVTIYCGTEAGPARTLVSPDVEVVSCSPPISRGWFSRIVLGWKLGPILKSAGPDVVFAPGNFHLLVLAALGWRLGGAKPYIVCKLSNPLVPSKMPNWLKLVLARPIRLAFAVVDQWTAMSPILAKEAAKLLGNEPLVSIAEPVLDVPSQPPTRQVRAFREPLILAIGRLEAQKDFALALMAFAEISPLKRARLVILGDGPDRSKLQAMARRLGIADHVEFPGYVTNVQDWLARAHLFLMTSRFEGFPAVLLEARAAGLPIITTNCSMALPEIILSERHGEILSGRDPQMIAGAICRWLENQDDDRLHRARGTECYAMDKVAPQWLSLFDRINE